ncbi:MAG: type I-A CRISPR-associated protein Cas7/Csa2 [Thermoprotei archaeon]|nr:MAG: type I-A CRISPR-associated protein Cas7/Csa2 [Thermoprotei archaeon]
MVYLSLGLRALVNVEALNMVESVGNLTRHRKAAIVYRRGNTYVLRYVPVISGESLAHAYQEWLVKLAKQRNLPICEFCEYCEFVKHAQPQVFGSKEWEVKLKNIIAPPKEKSKEKKAKKETEETSYDPALVETEIIKNCVVEDVGGFLLAGKPPVKRTSRFYVSYMIPAIDAIEKAALEPQMHVRHAPKASQKLAQAQMPYYVEVGSAIYSWSFYLDIGGIGVSSLTNEKVISDQDRLSRIELSLDALALMIETKLFGAKLTRFNPLTDYESVMLILSKTCPLTVSAPTKREYIKDTLRRAKIIKEKFSSEVKAFTYIADKAELDDVTKYAKEVDIELKTCDTVSEVVLSAKEVIKEWLSGK